MALTHSIMVGTYRSPAGAGSLLKIVAGGSAAIDIEEDVAFAALDTCARQAMVHGGHVYIPQGRGSSSAYGWASYNHGLSKAHLGLGLPTLATYILAFKDLVLKINTSGRATGPSVFYNDTRDATAFSNSLNDWARLRDLIFMSSPLASVVYILSYPFSGSFSTLASTVVHKMCEFENNMYGVQIVPGGTSYLKLYSGGVFNNIGSGFVLTESASALATATSVAMFKFNDKLFLLVHHSNAGTWMARCYLLDTVLGTATEWDGSGTPDVIPAGWKASPAATNGKIFEVRDDTGVTEKVFLIRCNYKTAGGWECYEFNETAFDWVSDGAEAIYPYSGVLYDELGSGAQIASAADSIPSSYASLGVEVAQLSNNDDVDIDPRYRDYSETPDNPPYHVCTEMAGVGSEGKVSLISKPAGISAIADLSDDFSGASLDLEKWEKVVQYTYYDTLDFGPGYQAAPPLYPISQSGGGVHFGSLAQVGGNQSGVFIKSKYYMTGAFQIDFIIQDIASLELDATEDYTLNGQVKIATNEGYGFKVYRTGASPYYIKAYVMRKNVNIVYSAAATFNPVEGTRIRIERDAAGAFTITVDPLGAPEVIDPGTGTLYPEPAQIWAGCLGRFATTWCAADPGPGFNDIIVAGAGSLGLYDGLMEHLFAWDHITDLGAGINKVIGLSVDTE